MAKQSKNLDSKYAENFKELYTFIFPFSFTAKMRLKNKSKNSGKKFWNMLELHGFHYIKKRANTQYSQDNLQFPKVE